MIKKFLDLGLQPLANKYLTKKDLVKEKVEYYYHLEVGFNTTSKLVSILNVVPSEKMFDKKYPYRASMSQTMMNSFKQLSRDIIKTFKNREAKYLLISITPYTFFSYLLLNPVDLIIL